MNIRITRMTTKCHCKDPKTSGDLSQIGYEVRKANRNRQENGFVSTIKTWTGSKDLGDNHGFGGCKVDTQQGRLDLRCLAAIPICWLVQLWRRAKPLGAGGTRSAMRRLDINGDS